MAQRASRHAQQKAFRDLDRTSTAGESTINLKFQGTIPTDAAEELSKMAKEFEWKNGREKRSWVDEDLMERLEVIGQHYGYNLLACLHGAFVLIYRHASEIVHGTYFGALFIYGMVGANPPPKTPEELSAVLLEHQATIRYCATLTNAVLLVCLSQHYSLPDFGNALKEFSGKAEFPYTDKTS